MAFDIGRDPNDGGVSGLTVHDPTEPYPGDLIRPAFEIRAQIARSRSSDAPCPMTRVERSVARRHARPIRPAGPGGSPARNGQISSRTALSRSGCPESLTFAAAACRVRRARHTSSRTLSAPCIRCRRLRPAPDQNAWSSMSFRGLGPFQSGRFGRFRIRSSCLVETSNAHLLTIYAALNDVFDGL